MSVALLIVLVGYGANQAWVAMTAAPAPATPASHTSEVPASADISSARDGNVNGEIDWDFVEQGRRRQVLHINRTIDRTNLANEIDSLSMWVTERLIELRGALEPDLERDLSNALAEVQMASGASEERQ